MIDINFTKRHYYANKLHINNENSQDTNNDTNQQYETPQFEDNGTKEQYETPIYDDQIEEMVQFPNGPEAVYAVKCHLKSTGHEEDVEDVNRT